MPEKSYPVPVNRLAPLMDEYAGICLECGEIQESGVEPDAEGYPCAMCGARAVTGIEQALLIGRIHPTDPDAEYTDD